LTRLRRRGRPCVLFACFTVVEYTHFAHGTGRPFEKIVYTWLGSGDGHLNFVKRDGTLASFNADAGFLLDPLSSIWLLFVTGVGMLIHIYSTGYMGARRRLLPLFDT